MESALEEQVNLVNAMALARERGIVIEERAADAPGDFATLVQSEVTTERKTYVAAGTLFGKQFLRLVRLGSYLLDAHIDGTLLVFTHMDRPGLIGFIGRTLGDEGVNIGQMNVGREQQGGEAIGVVNLDSVPVAQGPRGRAETPRHPQPQRHQAAGPGRDAALALRPSRRGCNPPAWGPGNRWVSPALQDHDPATMFLDFDLPRRPDRPASRSSRGIDRG